MDLTIHFSKGNGLIPAIIQDHKTSQVLMLGFMNEEAFLKTQETGNVHFFSRTRGKLWMKGETSGNLLVVKEIWLDCESDSLLILAEQIGTATCHTGEISCFHNRIL